MVTTEKKKKNQKQYKPRQRQEVQQYQEIKLYGLPKKKKEAQLPEVMVNAIMEQVEKKREEILKIASIENRPSIRLKRMEQGVVYPQIQQQGSAGIDLPTSINVNLPPGESAIVPTGWAISIPIGHVGLIKDRSSYAKERITTSGGVIDHGYHGEIKIIFSNNSRTFTKTMLKNEYVAQMIVVPVLTYPIREVEQLEDTPRGNRGFGSTNAFRTVIKKEVEVNRRDEAQKEDKHTYKIGANLTNEQRRVIRKIMQEYEDRLVTNFDAIISQTPTCVHDVDTGDAKPIKKAPYRIPYQYREWVEEELSRMLVSGLIRDSDSPWGSPVVIVPKKEIVVRPDKTREEIIAPRLCTDYRPLNDVTVKDAYPIPRIDDLLATMGTEPRFFTSFDLYSGYHQIALSPRAIKKSAFVVNNRHYEFTRRLFGMCNTPATFQRAMNKLFKDLIGVCVTIYIDDIQVYTKTFEDYVKRIKQVLERLRGNGFFLKPKKCTLAANKMKYLGFVLKEGGISTDESKVLAITTYPRPENVSEICAFLGLAMYY